MKMIRKRNQFVFGIPPTLLAGPVPLLFPLLFWNPSTSLCPMLPGVSFSWLQRHLFVIDFIFKLIFFFPFHNLIGPWTLPLYLDQNCCPSVFAPAISLLFCLDICFLVLHLARPKCQPVVIPLLTLQPLILLSLFWKLFIHNLYCHISYIVL